MRPSRIRAFSFLLLLHVGLATAAPPAIVKGEIQQFPVLIFDQPMLTWGDGKASPPDIRIEPRLDCSWQWDDDTTLQCHLSDQGTWPKPATSYRVVASGLWSQAGEKLSDGTTVVMETARPEVSVQETSWKDGWPTFEIDSSQHTTTEQLRAHVRLEDATGHALEPSWTVVAETAGQQMHWTLAPADRSGHDVVLQLRVLPGLQGSEGPLSGKQDQVLLKAVAGESFAMREAACGFGKPSASGTIECNPGDIVGLAFSQPLSDAAVQRLAQASPRQLEWLPKKDFGYVADRFEERSDDVQHAPGDAIAYRVLVPRQRIALRLPADLTDTSGHTIQHVDPLLVVSGDDPASVDVTPTLRMLLPPGSATTQHVAGVNLKDGMVEQTAIGNGLTTVKLPFTGILNNRSQAIRTPALPADVRRSGGIVDVRVAGYRWYEASYAGLQLIASSNGEEISVWATHWQGARPVAGARVELLNVIPASNDKPAQLNVLGNAACDAEGFARLRIPDGIREGEWLLRVSAGGKRSILRFRDLLPGRDNHREDRYATRQLRQWGVSDRPLYQPGASVRYRLWVRGRKVNHLVTPQLPEHLTVTLRRGRYSESQEIQTQEATIDALGGISGEFKLPTDAGDDDYCILVTAPTDIGGSGSCFRVSRYEPAELWAKIGSLAPLVHFGDKLAVDVEAGFLSGGSAGSADVKLQADLTPQSPGEAYTDYAAYEFGGNWHQNESLDAKLPAQKIEADGHAHVALPVVESVETGQDGKTPMAFAMLKVGAVVSYPGHAGIASETRDTWVSRYRRYIGLKVQPYFLTPGKTQKVEAVVISDTGTLLPGAPVHVTIRELPAQADDTNTDDAKSKPVAPPPPSECDVASGGSTTCAIDIVAGRRYEFQATNADAASTDFVHYAFKPESPPAADGKPRLVLSRADLRDADEQTPIAATSVRVHVSQPFARARLLLTLQHEQILRHWVQVVEGHEATLDIPIDPEWTPGATLAAVAIDASRAQDAPPADDSDSALSAELRLPIAQQHPPQPLVLQLPPKAEPGSEVILTLHNPRTKTAHATIAVVDDGIMARLSDMDGERLDPANSEWLGSLKQWSTAGWFGFVGWNESESALFDSNGKLDTPIITGSRIRPVITETASPMAMMAAPPGSGGQSGRLRTQFLETAFWQPDLELAAGQTREVKIRLPDNLTQWRAIVWAADGGDGFARSEATVGASLPIEARANVPTHLYVGDHALAEISARRTDGQSGTIELQGKASGAGVNAIEKQQANLPSGVLLPARMELRPSTIGTIDLIAQAVTAGGRDAVQQQVAVDDGIAAEHVALAGWLTPKPLSIALPRLATGALEPQLSVKLGRVDALLSSAWSASLRDYVHRCWEQTLSRAIGASLALKNGHDRAAWPDADAVLKDALDAAPGFVDRNGLFAYFHAPNDSAFTGSPILTAYTLDAFAEFKAMGHPVPDELAERAATALQVSLQALASIAPEKRTRYDSEIEAILDGSLADRSLPDAERLRVLWGEWDYLSWYARSQLVRALARQPTAADLAAQGLDRLRHAGVVKGERRVLVDDASPASEMGSLRRDQCAIIRTLTRLDPSEQGRNAVAALERGLFDLYAGGSWDSDTQTSAQCLLALHAAAATPSSTGDVVRVGIQAGSQHVDLALASGESEATWAADGAGHPTSLAIVRADKTLVPAAFVANIAYRRDQRIPAPAATGLHLDRSYWVLRNGDWVATAKTTLHEGDWVQVRLSISASSFRHFVAVSDPVPGGWVPEDVNLAGVAGSDLHGVAFGGGWRSPFRTRQLGTSIVRMYAEHLPPGRQDLVYYAQVRYSGHYLAPPATAETMYGDASYARTAPETVTIAP